MRGFVLRPEAARRNENVGSLLRSSLKVIGIDPGLADTGFGIVEGSGTRITRYSFGTIKTSRREPLSRRLNLIFSEIRSVLDTEKPDLVVLEDIFSLKQYPKSGISLGRVSGVILLACSHCDVVATEIPVTEVKRVLTGHGNAGKDQVERSVRYFLKRDEPITPSHASDAVALALVGLFRDA